MTFINHKGPKPMTLFKKVTSIFALVLFSLTTFIPTGFSETDPYVLLDTPGEEYGIVVALEDVNRSVSTGDNVGKDYGILHFLMDTSPLSKATPEPKVKKETVAQAISPEAFLFESGTVTIEAENYFLKTQPGSKSWDFDTSQAGFAGTGALRLNPNTGTKLSETQTALSPRLDYKIYVPEGAGGDYKIWVRGAGSTIYDDSVHFGVDGVVQSTSDRLVVEDGVGLNWSNLTMDNNDTGAAILNLTPGEHTINIWMREDGFVLDKFLLTSTSDVPAGQGPVESAQEGDGGPDPVDTTPPVISNVQTSVTENAVTITWDTDEPATSQVEYGLTSGLGTFTTVDATLKTSHSVTINGLTPDTPYFFKTLSEDEATNPAESPVTSFTTDAEPVQPEISPEAFLVEGGAVSIESESFFANTPAGGRSWDSVAALASYSGTDALVVLPNTGANVQSNQLGSSPRLDYKIYVPEGDEGTYTIWVRGSAGSSQDDSLHVGVNGSTQPSSDRVRLGVSPDFSWTNTTMDNNDTGLAQITLSAGEQMLNVWMREDGFTFDKIYLTKNSDTPSGVGSAESAQAGGSDPDPIDTTPPVISNVQTSATETSVTITWDTDEPATSQVEYGLSASLGTSTPVDSALKTSHSVTINGLTPDTPYFFKTLSEDEATNPAESAVSSVITDAEIVVDPEITPGTFLFENGTVVIEAENYADQTQPGTKSWDFDASDADASGLGALQVNPNTGTKLSETQTASSPRLDYKIYVPEGEGGNYKIWIRGAGETIFDDSVHFGVDGVVQSTSDRLIVNAGVGLHWSNTTMDNNDTGVALLNLTSGEHTLNIWMREDGFILDKFLLTNTTDIPTGQGPIQSEQVVDDPDPTDTEAPTGSISIAGNGYTNSFDVTVDLTATDNVGVTEMSFSFDDVTYTPYEPFANSKLITLPSGEGQKTIYAKFRDAAENESVVYSTTITLDQTAPEFVGNDLLELLEIWNNPLPDLLDHYPVEMMEVEGNLFVGAPSRSEDGMNASGAVYMLNGDATSPDFGEVILTILNPTPAQGDDFGQAIAVNDDYFFISAPDDRDSPIFGYTGSVYMFDGNPESSTYGELIHSFYAPSNNIIDFGRSVTVIGDYIAIGDQRARVDGSEAGAVFLYDANPASSSFGDLIHTFTNVTPASSERFGEVTYALGSNLYIASPGEAGSFSGEGKGYLFDADPDSLTFGDLLHTFNNPNPEIWDNYGGALAEVNGNLLMGSFGDDDGQAYLLNGDLNSPDFGEVILTFQHPDSFYSDRFGSEFLVLGTKLFIGSSGDRGVTPGQGAVFAYELDPASENYGELIISMPNPSPDIIDGFGSDLEVIGNRVFISVPGEPYGDISRVGAIYVYRAPPTNAVLINENAAQSYDRDVLLSLSIDDNLADRTELEMAFSQDGGVTFTPYEPFSQTKNLPLEGEPGIKEVIVRFKDLAGNVANFSDTIELLAPVLDANFSINNGDTFTNTRDVTLNIDDLSLGTQIETISISTDGVSYSSPVSFVNPFDFQLPEGDGEVTVYVKLESSDVADPLVLTDTIILDTTPSILVDQSLATNEGIRKTMILGPETTIASSVPVSYSFTADSILTSNGSFTLLDNQLMYIPDDGFTGNGQVHVTATHGSDFSTSTIDLEVKAVSVPNPNDTYFSSQYNLSLSDAARAWGLASGLGVTVAIIDSGIDLQHVDLNDNLYLNEGEIAGDGIDNDGNGFIDDLHGWDFENNDNDPDDDFFHGTHVAGIVAAEAGNGTGVAGLAKDANLMALKVLDSDGGGIINTVFQNVANSIDYAVAQGAKVINMSLGWWTSGISGAVVDALQASINAANAAGVVIVAAAGNDNTDAGLVTPAGLENVITVSATTSTDTKASFSNHGSVIDFSAPGSSVLSTDLSNGYAYASGTSMSAPLVAALAAMIMEQDDTATAEDVMRRLQYSALDLGTSGYDTTYGYGRIDAFKALSYDYYSDGTLKTQWLEQPDENGYTRLNFDLNGKLVGGA